MPTEIKSKIPKVTVSKLSVYSPSQIKSFGDVNKFLDEVALESQVKIPDFGFSEKEWGEMENLLKGDS